jgi:hypothetical protein
VLLTELLGPTLGDMSQVTEPSHHCSYVIHPDGK